METTRELLARTSRDLAAAGVPNPDVDAELLLAHVTGRSRALLRMAGSTVTGEQLDEYRDLVARRVRRIPLQHLTGLAPFRHLELHVGPGVFIPRPETELVVDHVLTFAADRAPSQDPVGSGSRRGVEPSPPAEPSPRPPGEPGSRAGAGLLVVDLCTGSGALALSIATEVPGSRVIAVELSPSAVAWARRNIEELGARVAAAGSSIELVTADATRVADVGGPLEELRGRVDVVVTNPPYVPDAAVPRDPEVRDHDPALALYGGPDGMAVVRPLTEQAALLLRPGGLLLVEHADVQGEDGGESGVPAVLRGQAHAGPAGTASQPTWCDVSDHVDLNGLPRHTSAIRAPGRMLP